MWFDKYIRVFNGQVKEIMFFLDHLSLRWNITYRSTEIKIKLLLKMNERSAPCFIKYLVGSVTSPIFIYLHLMTRQCPYLALLANVEPQALFCPKPYSGSLPLLCLFDSVLFTECSTVWTSLARSVTACTDVQQFESALNAEQWLTGRAYRPLLWRFTTEKARGIQREMERNKWGQ